MDFILEGLKGVAKSTDDLLIYGKTEAEHDERVCQVLHRLEENRVTCNTVWSLLLHKRPFWTFVNAGDFQ